MKFKVWLLTTDNGDGSSSVNKFGTEEQAEAYITAYNEDMCDYDINDENLMCHEFVFDDNGVLLNSEVYD